MRKIKQAFLYLRGRSWMFWVSIVVLYFAYSGVKSAWIDFRTNLFNRELAKRGLVLEREEALIVHKIKELEAHSAETAWDVNKNDFQKQKDNAESEVRYIKGISISNDDLLFLRNSDSLLSKWK